MAERRSAVASESALARSDELLSLFAAILRIAEIEGGALRRAFGRVDLSGLVNDLAESYAPAVIDSRRSLSWYSTSSRPITASNSCFLLLK